MSRRILHVTQAVEAGVGAMVAAMADHQAAHGWDVRVACPAPSELTARLDSRVGIVPWKAGRDPGLDVPDEVRRLRSIVDAVAPDVIHLHSSKAGLAGRLAVRGSIPTIFQPHAWSFLAVDGLTRSAAVGWERFAVRWTDLVILVSDAEAHAGADVGVAAGNALVVPNGIDADTFCPGERAAARRDLALEPDPLVVCVGRLCRQKGQDLLLDCWPEVLRAVPKARLVLVGDGPDREALERRGVPRVHFAGPRQDVVDWYAAADVVAVPSRWEGMALVPLEAMACARPVVSFGVAGMAQSVGEGGHVAAAGDLASFTAALVSRLTDPGSAELEGRAGRARVVEQFSVARSVDEVTAAATTLVS